MTSVSKRTNMMSLSGMLVICIPISIQNLSYRATIAKQPEIWQQMLAVHNSMAVLVAQMYMALGSALSQDGWELTCSMAS